MICAMKQLFGLLSVLFCAIGVILGLYKVLRKDDGLPSTFPLMFTCIGLMFVSLGNV